MAPKKLLIVGIRWIARLLGGLIVEFFLILSIGYALESPNLGPGKEPLLKFLLGDMSIILMLVGIIVAWLREVIGGEIILGGFVFYLTGVLITTKSYPDYRIYWSWFYLIFPVIGLLHFVCWWQSREKVSQAHNKNVSK